MTKNSKLTNLYFLSL